MDGESLFVTAGTVFAVSSRSGDILPRNPQGFYAYDTRFLSQFTLSIDGKSEVMVDSGTLNHALASFYDSYRNIQNFPSGTIAIIRDRYVSHGLHEDISLSNYSTRTRTVRLELTFDADFADVFEVRLGNVHKVGQVTVEERQGQQFALVYDRGQFHRETWISFSELPVINGKTAIFNLSLPPRGNWKTCVNVLPVVDKTPPPALTCLQEVLGAPFSPYRPGEHIEQLLIPGQKDPNAPLKEAPVLQTNDTGLKEAYDQAVVDLRALLMPQGDHNYIFAAGLPWFMAIFGRDSIISAIQTKILGTDIMRGTLATLARLQANQLDEFRDAEPGKMPHEVRNGELSFFEQVPHSRYYGSVDATPLYITLLWEAYQWTSDITLLKELLPIAEKAMMWINVYGDLDGDGFVEYARKSSKGLRNQGWKDSSDSVSFANGRLAEGNIALCEVQGYVYDAKIKMGQIYRALGDSDKARIMENEAETLKKHFNDAFWMPEEGYYAIALDGHKHPVNSISSNPGHCLWSGIVDYAKASQVAERIMAPDMFNGWGIRTLSSKMARYNPLSYHNGSVWPHDNSIIAAGLHRYGFTDKVDEVIYSLLDAAAALPNHRLPELLTGFERRIRSFPVPNPAANSPQAWASGTIIYFVETLLGVTPVGDKLMLEAPRDGKKISLTGVKYREYQFAL